MWGVLSEYVISVLWCYAFLITLALTLLALGGLVPATLAPNSALLSIWGMLLSVACLVQFATGLWIDRKHEASQWQTWRPLLWVIWYPVVYWLLSAATTAVGFPRAAQRRSGRRARWVSPDRGFR